MKYKSLSVFVALITALSACNDILPKQNLDVHTQGLARGDASRLSGRAFEVGPLPNAKVTCKTLRLNNDRTVKEQSELVSVGRTNERGGIDLAKHNKSLPYVVSVQSSEQDFAYRAYVFEDNVNKVIVTPISTLIASLTDYHTQQGMDLPDAFEAAQKAFSAHLMLTNIASTEPIEWPSKNDKEKAIYVTSSEVSMALALRTIGRLADDLSATGSSQSNNQSGYVNVPIFTRTLAGDIKADGVLDGLDGGNDRLKIGSQTYDGQIFRQKYAHALLAEADSSAVQTSLSRHALCPIAESIVTSSRTEFLASPTPEIFACEPQLLTLKGSAKPIEAPAGWTVQVFRADSYGYPVPGPLATSKLDDRCEWTLSFTNPAQPLVIQAFAEGEQEPSLTAFIRTVLNQATAKKVHLHPLTTIKAAYARYLAKQGEDAQQAADKAQHGLAAAFGDLTSEDIEPAPLNLADRLNKKTTTHDGERLSLLLEALKKVAEANRPADQSNEKLYQLTSLLAEDIESDGHFDGNGSGGRALATNHRPLSTGTLREQLASSMLLSVHEAEQAHRAAHNLSASEKSTLSQSLSSWAIALAEANTGPFAAEITALDLSGPALQACRYLDLTDLEFAPSAPKIGTITVICRFSSPQNIKEIAAHFTDGSKFADHAAANQEMFQDNTQCKATNTDEITMLINTAEVGSADGPIKEAEINFAATDGFGKKRTSSISFSIDNTPPAITCHSCEQSPRSGQITRLWVGPDRVVSGSLGVAGASKSHLILSSTNGLRYTVQENDDAASDTAFTHALTGVLDHGLTSDVVTVQAFDRFQNHSTLEIQVVSSGQGPQFRSDPFVVEANNSGTRINPDDADYRHRLGVPSRMPLLFHYANMLDYVPDAFPPPTDPLPVVKVHFEADEDSARITQVEYRAVPCINLQCSGFKEDLWSEWRPATPAEGGVYSVLLSYQTLLPSVVLEGYRDGAIAAAKWLQHDASARKPAAYRIQFRATDHTGQTSFETFDFLMETALPPVQIQTFMVPDWHVSDAYRNMEHLHGPTGRNLLSANVKWQVWTAPGGLYRPEPIEVSVSSAQGFATYSDAASVLIKGCSKPVSANKRADGAYRPQVAKCESRAKAKGFVDYISGISWEDQDRCMPLSKPDLDHDRYNWNTLKDHEGKQIDLGTEPFWVTPLATTSWTITPSFASTQHAKAAHGPTPHTPDWVEGSWGNTSGLPFRWVKKNSRMLFFTNQYRQERCAKILSERLRTDIKIRLLFNQSRPSALPENVSDIHDVEQHLTAEQVAPNAWL